MRLVTSVDASDSFILSQMPVESYIRLETEALPISATAAHHEIAVETSVDSGIDLSVSYGDEEGGAWIENLTLADGKLAFDAGENGSSERRIAVISLLYQDEFGRTTEAAVRITQSFSMNPSAATEKDFAFAAALGTGDVEENVYVTGQIVLDAGATALPDGTLRGDVAPDAAAITVCTPVPGGIGSVTTALLLRHTVQAAENLRHF